MTRRLHRLSAKFVSNHLIPGYHADGGGLYLQVSDSGTKSWIFRYTLSGRTREMGLGSLATVTLADARKRATSYRGLLHDKIDPIRARSAERAQHALDRAKGINFSTCAERYIDSQLPKWKNAKHVTQWRNTIETYCQPIFGNIPIAEVDTGLVMRVLEPMWHTKSETASRLRGRIESILDWATVRGYRVGDNPARWRGHLDKLLPTVKKRSRVRHHPALPYEQIGAFMALLRTQDGIAARALEFAIFTAARTGEVVGVRTEEIDLSRSLWTIPGERMKSGREHRVPLSTVAVEIVRERLQVGGNFLFAGRRHNTSLSSMAMLMLLRRMDRADLTVHGFRSTFRDWAAECTSYPREVAEMALAHVVSDQTEAAYRRGDLFEKRRQLMNDWSKYCGQPLRHAKILKLGKAA